MLDSGACLLLVGKRALPGFDLNSVKENSHIFPSNWKAYLQCISTQMRISGLLLSMFLLKLQIPEARNSLSQWLPLHSWLPLVVVKVHDNYVRRPPLMNNSLLNAVFSLVWASVLNLNAR